jgi:CheY-like chemotaxis protein
MALCILVEDHGDTREGYAEYLSSLGGYTVRGVAGVDELERVLAQQVPDAFVLDLHLPGVDGWTLTRRIKADKATAHVPIIIVSACVLPADQAAAYEAGCDLFLPKPCDPAQILDALNRLVPAGT